MWQSKNLQTNIAVIARLGAHKLFLEKGAREIDCRKAATPFGDSAPIHILDYGGIQFAVISRHGEESYTTSSSFVNYRANIWGLKDVGVEKIVSWSAPGAINENFTPGDIIVIDDLIDETKNREYTFFEGKGIGFVRQNPVFCPELREVFLKNLSSYGRYHDGGVYVVTEGPRLETPAEIRKYKILGGELVGMMLVPEVFLAKELEMCYAAMCYVVNYAEGLKDSPIQPGVLFEGLLAGEDKPKVDAVEAAFPNIMLGMLHDIAATRRECHCKNLMLRYKLRGDIGDDWRQWV